jgi:AcrR family transcriptional regulator
MAGQIRTFVPVFGAMSPAPLSARPRDAILEHAMDLASVDGLQGLTIGALAARLEMSKSALFARFGSKEELQLATVDGARRVLEREVIAPAAGRRAGLDRVHGLVEAYLAYLQAEVFAGGCLLSAAVLEFDGRPGPVRDAIAAASRSWSAALEGAIADGLAGGEIARDADAAQIAFEINALLNQANAGYQMSRDRTVFGRARLGIARALG